MEGSKPRPKILICHWKDSSSSPSSPSCPERFEIRPKSLCCCCCYCLPFGSGARNHPLERWRGCGHIWKSAMFKWIFEHSTGHCKIRISSVCPLAGRFASPLLPHTQTAQPPLFGPQTNKRITLLDTLTLLTLANIATRSCPAAATW